ncbi:TetR/AcrR family transcriptional regulator [Kineobactrum salinum]|uniref:TetR family transcriptional regulator n=1 Tax=Kineobactrum salinum TaxID=2708301 RepID=A0A6C0U0W5_9GAMM|nr:TetR/AcrR family transcriptional regulator [Kineobactrum salinum]QIB64617.1 TetR family transcriptional regulator [Kineobactrum salinum]
MSIDRPVSEQARRKLILAAIRLFANHGVESVSLRMINREAGSRNNSALHYHFGSKLGLIEAVDDFIQTHFDKVREDQLCALERRAACETITVREAMDVLVQAYVDIIEGYDWGYDAVRTLARMEFDGIPEVIALLGKSAGHSANRFARLKRPLLPELKPRQFKMRYNFVVNATIQGFADYRNLHQSYLGDLSVKNLDELAAFYAQAGTAVLTAPPGNCRHSAAPTTPFRNRICIGRRQAAAFRQTYASRSGYIWR